MTVTQETADTVSGTVSKDSIPQNTDLSTDYAKKVDGKRDLAPRILRSLFRARSERS